MPSLPLWGAGLTVTARVYTGGAGVFTLDSDRDALDSGWYLSPATGDPAGMLDVTADVMALTVKRGASFANEPMSTADAGTGIVELFDPAGRYDPGNPRAPWFPELRAGAWFTASAELAGVEYPLFAGRVDRMTWAGNVAVWRIVDEWVRLVQYDGAEQPPAGAGETSSERCLRILDAAGWPDELRDVWPGGRAMNETTLAQPAATELELVAASDMALCWVNAAGKLSWRPWPYLVSRPPPTLTITDPVATLVRAVTLSGSDTSWLRNDISAARAGGTEQRATNAASVARYGRRTWGRNDLALATDTDVASWARTVLDWYGDPPLGVPHLVTLDPVRPGRADLWARVLSVDVGSRVQLSAQPASSAQRYTYGDLTVHGFMHTIRPGSWLVDLVTEPVGGVVGVTGHWTLNDPYGRARLDFGNTLAEENVGPPSPPTVTLTADVAAGPVGLVVTYRAAVVAHPDAPVTAWTFSPGDGTAPSSGTGPPPEAFPHTYTTAGTYTATLDVSSVAGSTSAAASAVTVYPAPHIAGFGANPRTGITPLTVTFLLVVPADQEPRSYVIDPGDGHEPYTGTFPAGETVVSVEHTYTLPEAPP